MKFSLPVKSREEIKLAKEYGISEVIISPSLLSRFGTIDLNNALFLADVCKEYEIISVLEWDALFTNDSFEKVLKGLSDFNFSNFDEIRVQDPGVYHWCLSHTKNKIQLNLETGNHNLECISSWISYSNDRLSKVVLSHEIPKDKITTYTSFLNIPVELMGVGRILLFYTPRRLLTSYHVNPEKQVEVEASSEETPHSGFKVLQNYHGTFMFNPKDQFLLDQMDDIRDSGVHWLRLDLRFHQLSELLPKIMSSVKTRETKSLKEEWPTKLFAGFFRVNKTDILFKKLKNKVLVRDDEKYLGVVLDVIKKEKMGIRLNTSKYKLSLGDSIELRTPEGKVKNYKVDEMTNSQGELVQSANSGDIIFMKHVGGVSIRSAVYLS
ncbi:MAG: U32 family peptidase C-terminal domain-containing protein [Bacteriovoracaceae bacterium]|nr:U32 family peptidase C-terminal domain-containing protein [Bacteriovoracaceae bacterium]